MSRSRDKVHKDRLSVKFDAHDPCQKGAMEFFNGMGRNKADIVSQAVCVLAHVMAGLDPYEKYCGLEGECILVRRQSGMPLGLSLRQKPTVTAKADTTPRPLTVDMPAVSVGAHIEQDDTGYTDDELIGILSKSMESFGNFD